MVRCIRLDFRLLINYKVINLMLRCIRQDYGFKSVKTKQRKRCCVGFGLLTRHLPFFFFSWIRGTCLMIEAVLIILPF